MNETVCPPHTKNSLTGEDHQTRRPTADNECSMNKTVFSLQTKNSSVSQILSSIVFLVPIWIAFVDLGLDLGRTSYGNCRLFVLVSSFIVLVSSCIYTRIFYFWLRLLDQADYTVNFSVHVSYCIVSYL